MAEQKQNTGAGSLAIQSQRDTTIHQGLSPNELRSILDAIAGQFPHLIAAAGLVVDQRLREFKEEVLAKFADENAARTDAFQDPDFLFAVQKAQEGYARSGDGDVRSTLVDLIALRSKQIDRSRLALTLDDAVTKVAVLTKNEFAELSLIYLFKHTINNRINSPSGFSDYLRQNAIPLLQDISEADASYSYLEAQSCGTRSIVEIDLGAAFRENYAGVLGKGLPGLVIESLSDSDKSAIGKDHLVIECLNDNSKVQPNALNKAAFFERAERAGLSVTTRNAIWTAFEGSLFSNEEIVQKFGDTVPGIANLFRLWKDTPLKNMNLTTVGLAIAHANLVRLVGFDADLAVWIK